MKKRYDEYTPDEFNKLTYGEQCNIKEEFETYKQRCIIRKRIIMVIISIVTLFIIITIFNSFKSIPTGFVGVKTRFGKVQDTTIQEGLNTKIPYIEKIVKIDCRTQKIEYNMEGSSKDLQKITGIKVAVNYSVDKQKANILYKEIGTAYNSIIIEPSIYESVKAAIANYTAEELITKRQEVSISAYENLANKLNNMGINILSLNLIDMSFSPEFDAAIEKKQVVEQQTQQAKYELEKAKVENEKQIENAKTEAEVMKQKNQQITENALRLKELEIQQNLINKWNGQLPNSYAGNDVMSIFKVKE